MPQDSTVYVALKGKIYEPACGLHSPRRERPESSTSGRAFQRDASVDIRATQDRIRSRDLTRLGTGFEDRPAHLNPFIPPIW